MNKDLTDCIISKKQAQYIHNIFRRLCLNRIQNKQTKQTIKSHSLIKDECIFKPQLNKVSKDLAGRKLRKNKSIGQNIYDSMTNKEKKNNEWRAAQNKIKEQELMRECTFTPEVRSLIRSYHNRSDSKNLLDKSSLYERSNDRCKRHQMSIDKSFTDQDSLQQDKSTVDVKKTTKTSEKCKKTKAATASMRSVENSIYRMREANIENKIVTIMKRTGVSRKRAQKMVENDSYSNLSSMINRCIKSNNSKAELNSKNERNNTKYDAENPQSDYKYNNKKLPEGEINLSTPDVPKSESKNQKTPVENRSVPLSEMIANPTHQQMNMLKNLEECLNNFLSEKSSSSTPMMKSENAQETSEKQSFKENYTSNSSPQSNDNSKINEVQSSKVNTKEKIEQEVNYDETQIQKEIDNTADYENNCARTVTFGNENDDEKEEFDKPEEQTLSKPIINKPKPTRSPLLFIDVSIGPDQTERIIVYEDDTAINQIKF